MLRLPFASAKELVSHVQTALSAEIRSHISPFAVWKMEAAMLVPAVMNVLQHSELLLFVLKTESALLVQMMLNVTKISPRDLIAHLDLAILAP